MKGTKPGNEDGKRGTQRGAPPQHRGTAGRQQPRSPVLTNKTLHPGSEPVHTFSSRNLPGLHGGAKGARELSPPAPSLSPLLPNLQFSLGLCHGEPCVCAVWVTDVVFAHCLPGCFSALSTGTGKRIMGPMHSALLSAGGRGSKFCFRHHLSCSRMF